MGHCIHARMGRYRWGLGDRQPWVEDRYSSHSFRIEAGHFLVSLIVGDQRSGLAFATCPGGGGNGNEREHRFGRLAYSPVILHAPPIGEEKVTAFCRIHGAPSSEPDEQINALRTRHLQAILYIASRRIFPNLIK